MNLQYPDFPTELQEALIFFGTRMWAEDRQEIVRKVAINWKSPGHKIGEFLRLKI
jgi:hypothetical protein